MISHPLIKHRIDAISVTTSTILMISHQLYLWDLILYIYVDIIFIVYNNIFTIFYHNSDCTFVSHPLFPWYHTLCIHDISPTIFDTTATASVWSHLLYWCHHKNYGSHHIGTCMTLYTVYITSHSHYMTSILSIYDIINTAFMTSDLLYMTSHPLFRTSHNFMYDIKSTVSGLMSTVSVSSHPPYRWHHSQYIDGITSSVSVTSYPLYLWNNIH